MGHVVVADVPLLIVRINVDKIGPDFVPLLRKLQWMVAEVLHTDEHPVEVGQVEVQADFCKFAISPIDLSIRVVANDYPDRREIIEKAAELLRAQIVGPVLPPGASATIRIELMHGTYRETRNPED